MHSSPIDAKSGSSHPKSSSSTFSSEGSGDYIHTYKEVRRVRKGVVLIYCLVWRFHAVCSWRNRADGAWLVDRL